MGKPLTLSMQMMMMAALSLGILTATSKTNALTPYTTTRSPSWDMMMLPSDDPFRILEQTPFTVPKPGLVQETVLALARADWKETASAHVITLDIPGLKKEDVKIEVEENRVLRISGERKADEEAEGDKWHRAERTHGKFWRQFRLPGNADLDHTKAHLEDGVLRITVPKFVTEKKRQPKLIYIAHQASSSDDADIKATKVA